MTILMAVLSCVFTILKIAVIILLIALGIILLILGSVLLVPVRYRAMGSFDSLSPDFNGEFKITWFLHLLSVKIWFRDKKPCYWCKILGIKIADSDKIKDKGKKTLKEKTSHRRSKEKNDNAIKPDTGEVLEDIDSELSKNQNTNKALEKKDEDFNKESYVKEKPADKKVFKKINNIKFKFIKICDTIKNVNGIKEKYMQFLTTEESRQAIRDIKAGIFKIICHIKPTRLKLYLKFGFPDPALTGQIYGFMCVFLARYGNTIYIEPQFSDVNRIFADGNFKLKGRIRLGVLLFYGIKIYANKRLKEFIAFVKG